MDWVNYVVTEERRNALNGMVLPLASGTSTADIQAALDNSAGERAVRFNAGTYTITTPLVVPSNTHIIMDPNTVIYQTLTGSGGTTVTEAAFYAGPIGVSTDEYITLAAACTLGSQTISTNEAPVVGDILQIRLHGSGLLAFYYEVIAVADSGPYTVTLDRPLCYPFLETADIRSVISIPTNIRIEGNGALISGTGDRYIEFAGAQDCLISGIRCNASLGHLDTQSALMSFDIGSLRCVFRDCHITHVGTNATGGGILLESAELCRVEDCSAGDIGTIGIAMWDCMDSAIVNSSGWGNSYGAYTGSNGISVGCYRCTIQGGTYYKNSLIGVSLNGPSTEMRVIGASTHSNGVNGLKLAVSGSDASVANLSCENEVTAVFVVGSTTMRGNDWVIKDSSTTDIFVNGTLTGNNIKCSGAAPKPVDVVAGTVYFTDLVVDATYGTAHNVVELSTSATGYFTRPKLTATTSGSTLIAVNSGPSKCWITDGNVLQTGMTGIAGYNSSTTRISGDMNHSWWAAHANAHINYGELTLDGATPVAVAYRGIRASDQVILTLKTVGGTQGPPPICVVTANTGFSVTGTALDTSVYSWRVV